MNRYFFYMSLVNMLANMAATLPKILIENRTGGAILAMLLSLFPGLLFVYIFLKFFKKFKGKGLPEILPDYFPGWFTKPVILIISFAWFTAGLLTLTSFSFMMKRFLSPETPLILIVSIFLLFISYGILMNSKNVLYAIEIIFLIVTPFIFLFTFKALASKELEWDFIKQAVMYSNHLPNLTSLTTSIFIYLGIANILIFNREFKEGYHYSWKDFVIIGYFGLSLLIVSFFTPIGLNGFDNIGTIIYPGMAVSDALRMPYGIIERVIYVVLILTTCITFLSMLIHWHVALELLKSVFNKKLVVWKKKNLTPYLFIIIYWLVSINTVLALDEHQLIHYSSIYYKILISLFIFASCLFIYILRRAKKQS